MSNVVNLEPGRERTLLKTSLASSRDAVGVPTSPISANGDASAVEIALLWADLANHFGVSDFLSEVGGYIFEADEEEGVGSLDLLASAVGGGADTLAESAEFVGVGIVPDLVEVWVLTELTVFECLYSGFVKDGKGPLLYKGRGIGASGRGVG